MAKRGTTGRGTGRPPDGGRRGRVAELRARGLSGAEIARRLGITSSAVSQVDRPRCDGCGARVVVNVRKARGRRPAFCLRCLVGHPEGTFGQRLRSLRLTRGMSHEAPAGEAGISGGQLVRLEDGAEPPTPQAEVKLVRVLGQGLLATAQRGK